MSDDAEQYFKAWISVFGGKTRKLLCSWHVDRAWRIALSKVKDKEMQQRVYHNVRVLMEETDVMVFEQLLQRTVQQFKSSKQTKDFGDYFEKHYVQRKQQWA
jgi:hypothetical protein